jgi:hypothetical protein
MLGNAGYISLSMYKYYGYKDIADIKKGYFSSMFLWWRTRLGLGYMVFNATFNDSSVISWRSVLLVEETRVTERNTINLSQVTDKFYHIMYRVHLARAVLELTTLVNQE